MQLGRWTGAVVAAMVAAVVTGAAEAHTFGVSAAGFSAGLAHPLVGLDHLLAMIAVGLWAVQIADRTEHATALWLVPASFLAAMTAGGVLAMAEVGIPQVELGILGSLVVLGVLIAAAPRLPVWAGAAVVGAFALFHGHAHGTEAPAAASAALYAAGFLVTTTFLHGVGVGLGLVLREGQARLVTRFGGVGIAAAGLALYILA